MYEEKCKEFIQSQIAIQESINRQNRNNTNQPTNSASNPITSTNTASNPITSTNTASNSRTSTNPLYPNLQSMVNHNNVQAAANNNYNISQSSTSNNIYQSATPKTFSVPPTTVRYSQITPSAPPKMSNIMATPPAKASSSQITPSAPPKVSNIMAAPPAKASSSQITPSAPPKVLNIMVLPPAKASSSQITPSAPKVSNIMDPSPDNIPDNNDRNFTNRGAIPKNRRKQSAQKKQALMGVECVTCKGEFGLQIYQCENGHSSCNNCRFANKLCGVCSKTIIDMRNITLEATIADMNIKQNTKSDGCSLSFSINEMGNHLKECPFNDIECPLSSTYKNCTWKGKINQISIHFNDAHPQHCVADVDKEMTLLNINVGQSMIYFVKIGPFNFLVHIKVDENEKILYMTAQLLGTKVSASKWTYELHIYNKRQPQRKFQYIDVCYSNTESVTEIFNRAQCAALTLEYAQTFVNDGLLMYKFFLKKKINVRKNEQ
ncbi:unnamed protein product [Euphydryas editha]|uniref:E3 ubiquitin-protein ligase n=1 Tax=Euphydryas editha TaxID=104508 RepID=A0AAU9U3S7_EUPED|nr:unnamed protein product [Euphydryas editha]